MEEKAATLCWQLVNAPKAGCWLVRVRATGNGFYSVGLFVACCTAWLLKGRVSGTQRDTDRQGVIRTDVYLKLQEHFFKWTDFH